MMMPLDNQAKRLCNAVWYVAKQPITSIYVGITVPHSSPYRRQITESMVQFHSLGLAKHWFDKYTSPRAGACKKIVISYDMEEIDDQFSTNSKTLCFHHFLKFIAFLLIGLSFCSAILIGEKVAQILAEQRLKSNQFVRVGSSMPTSGNEKRPSLNHSEACMAPKIGLKTIT